MLRRTTCSGTAVLILAACAHAAMLAGCKAPNVYVAPRAFQAHIDKLASDAWEGRGVGSKGIESAGRYIANEFRQMGLEPGGDDGTYRQSFEMAQERKLVGSRLAFAYEAETAPPEPKFVPFSFSADDAFDGDVVFCGYGISAMDRGYDDFAHVDLTGKVALMLRHEPSGWADEDGNTTPHAWFRNKVYNAKDRGAVAVLMVNTAPAEGEPDEPLEFVPRGSDAFGIPALHVARESVEPVLAAGGLSSLTKLQQRLDDGGMASAPLDGVRASGKVDFKTQTTTTSNVVGIWRGTGPHANECVVIGAHYDHLGIRRPMTRTFKDGKLVREVAEPQIHNGADDNASGTSGLLEIARAFTKGGPRDRSVVFVAFTAEESGLHGARHYVEHPSMPLDKVVAMINMDMIGRLDPGSTSVQVFGVGTGLGLEDIVRREARAVGLTVATTGDAGGRSDHAAFVRSDIPSLHFFTGQHSDYHKPTDDADKINAKSGAQVAAAVYRVARALADRPERLVFQKPERDQEQGMAGTPSYRVVMGLAPGYGDDGEPGMRVDAVNPDGPAELAGMKAKDRIIRIADKKVDNIYDYMAATRNNNPGDVVAVVVLRDGQEVTLKVTLASAR